MSSEFTKEAKKGYEAYSEHAGGKSLVTGDPLPTWEKLTPAVQEAWCVAAEAIVRQWNW